MEKTTVYLSAEQKAALARAATAAGRSEARLIRAGIDIVTAGHRVAETTVPLYEEAAAAGLPPNATRPRWLSRDEFTQAVLRHQADPALGRELRELSPDTTDEAGIP